MSMQNIKPAWMENMAVSSFEILDGPIQRLLVSFRTGERWFMNECVYIRRVGFRYVNPPQRIEENDAGQKRYIDLISMNSEMKTMFNLAALEAIDQFIAVRHVFSVPLDEEELYEVPAASPDSESELLQPPIWPPDDVRPDNEP